MKFQTVISMVDFDSGCASLGEIAFNLRAAAHMLQQMSQAGFSFGYDEDCSNAIIVETDNPAEAKRFGMDQIEE